MSISGTEAVTTGATGLFAPGGSSSATAPANEADKEMFLQLLVAQMRYQDPLNPTDSNQFLAQSAQFTALEKMQEVADQTSQLLSAQVAFGASGLVGREVTYTSTEGSTVSGTVSGVTFGGAEGPLLDVGGAQVPLSLVQSVTAGSTGSSSSTDTSTATTTSPTA